MMSENKLNKIKLFSIRAIYVLFFIYTILQSVVYANTLRCTAPDEIAHTSYVAYLYDTKKIIPNFEDMHMLNNSPIKWSFDCYAYRKDLVNYLCHPPLYYHIMRLAGGISHADNHDFFIVNFSRLRYFSIGIMATGLFAMLYIGYSRIDKKHPIAHLLYSAIVCSVPMLAYEGGAVTNDNLTLLTVALGLLGYFRFIEEKRNFTTYLLIALGISASLLTKMTAAILLVIMGAILLLYTMIKEHSIKKSLNKYFLLSIPIYLITLVYFGIMYSKYGTITPSLELICTKEYFESTYFFTPARQRVNYSLSEYLRYYFENFFLSFCSCYGGEFYYKLSVFSKAALVIEVLFFLPVPVLIMGFFKKKIPAITFVICGYLSIIITFLMQLKSAYKSFLGRGYMGGYQARYYIAAVVIFGISADIIYSSIITLPAFTKSKYAKLFKAGLNIVCIAFIIALVYANFPFYLKHFT